MSTLSAQEVSLIRSEIKRRRGKLKELEKTRLFCQRRVDAIPSEVVKLLETIQKRREELRWADDTVQTSAAKAEYQRKTIRELEAQLPAHKARKKPVQQQTELGL